MDQQKIGRFIAERRKAQKLTQMELAERLSITDRAVSKWENGKAMPDSSIMLELCGILEITVNDLLSGEVVAMENYNKELEKNMLEMVREKEKADKRLLILEIVLGLTCCAFLLVAAGLAPLLASKEWQQGLIILAGLIPLLIALPFLIKIEQTAGYYECSSCGHKYVPSFKSVLWAPHMGRTRHMRCPKCHKKSWQKKRIRKD